ncbi:MAG: alcohol dehydrogenase catalytic domain-containing protein [Planctomycetaceae bacterium]
MKISTGTAVLFNGTGKELQITQTEFPDLAAGEVLVQISATTLCGSDLHTYEGRRQTATPAVLGHEIIGRVVALSEIEPATTYAGESLQIGDRVTWSLCVHCGECFFCEHDLPQKCEQLLKYGHQSFATHPWCGGLATHIILRRHSSPLKFPIPSLMMLPVLQLRHGYGSGLRRAGGVGERKCRSVGGGDAGSDCRRDG